MDLYKSLDENRKQSLRSAINANKMRTEKTHHMKAPNRVIS